MIIYSLYYTHKPGGFCKRLYRLLNALALDGHEVIYFSLDQPPKTLCPKVGYRQIPFPLKTRSGIIFWVIFTVWASIFSLWSSSGKASRWVVFSPFYGSLLAPVKFILGLPIICFIRSKLAPTSESKLLSSIENLSHRICFRICDKIILQTRANLELARSHGLATSKASILPNNIDKISEGYDIKSTKTELQILTTGVFTKNKNLTFLTAVWNKLEDLCSKKSISCPKLKIIGIIREDNFNHAFSKNISVSGWQEDLVEHYTQFQIYLHPSLHEGMPNSALEAMGNGLVVLVADTTELQELVGDKDLCFDCNKPEQLACKLFELQSNSAELTRLKELSLKRAKELCFDWDQQARILSLN